MDDTAEHCWHGGDIRHAHNTAKAQECPRSPFAAQQSPKGALSRPCSQLTIVEADDDPLYSQSPRSVPDLQGATSEPFPSADKHVHSSSSSKARLRQASNPFPSSSRGRTRSTPSHLQVLSQALFATRNALEVLHYASGSSAALTCASSSGGMKTSISTEEIRDLDSPITSGSVSFSAGVNFGRGKRSASTDQPPACGSPSLSSCNSMDIGGTAARRHQQRHGPASTCSPPLSPLTSPLTSHHSVEVHPRHSRRRAGREGSHSGNGGVPKGQEEQQRTMRLSRSTPCRMHEAARDADARRAPQGTPRHGPVGRARRNGYMLPPVQHPAVSEKGDFDFWSQQLALAVSTSPGQSESRSGGSEGLLVVWE